MVRLLNKVKKWRKNIQTGVDNCSICLGSYQHVTEEGVTRVDISFSTELINDRQVIYSFTFSVFNSIQPKFIGKKYGKEYLPYAQSNVCECVFVGTWFERPSFLDSNHGWGILVRSGNFAAGSHVTGDKSTTTTDDSFQL